MRYTTDDIIFEELWGPKSFAYRLRYHSGRSRAFFTIEDCIANAEKKIRELNTALIEARSMELRTWPSWKEMIQ